MTEPDRTWWDSHWHAEEQDLAALAWAGRETGAHDDLSDPTPAAIRTRDRWLAQIAQALPALDADPRDVVARGLVGEAWAGLDQLLAPAAEARDDGARRRWLDDLHRERLAPAPPPLPLHTERLVLRPFEETDVDAAHRFYRRDDVTAHLLHPAATWRETEARIKERVTARAPAAAGRHLCLAVVHDETLIGDVMMRLEGPALCQAEIGWVFDPEHQGRGFATEAAAALLDLAFGHYALWRVFAMLDARNTASAALCERLGMSRELATRADYWSKGTWTPSRSYAAYADTRA